MKRNLFVLSTAALVLTPAIIAHAEESTTQVVTNTAQTTKGDTVPSNSIIENQWLTVYESPFYVADATQDNRMIASAHSLEYTATSAQGIADSFLTGLEAYGDAITIHYTGSLNFDEIYDEVLSVWYNIHDLNDYLSGNVSSIKLSGKYNGETKSVIIDMSYHANHTQQQYITNQVEQIAKKIIKPDMSDFEKVKAVTDYIVLNHSYNLNTQNSPHSVYTFLTEKQGVCQAYALLAQRIFDEIGIPSHYVTGFARGNHAWNLVQVNGAWYHLDVTWADPAFSKYDDSNKNYISYGHFLMSDQQIAADHKVDAKEKNLPKATSTRYTAYHSIQNPVQVGDELFFPNYNDDIKLYKINLNDPVPTMTKFSDNRFQHLFYANGFLYFSDYSNSRYLSKLDLNTMEITLLKREKVTHIIREGQYMVAYNGSKAIYSEEIVDDGSTDANTTGIVNPAIQDIIDKIDALESSSVTFLDDFIIVTDLLDALTEQEVDQITNIEILLNSSLIAEQYIAKIDELTNLIGQLTIETPLVTLKSQAIQARRLVDQAHVAIVAYIDLSNLQAVEKYITEKELAQSDKEQEIIEQAKTLLKDFKFLNKDFASRAEQINVLLAMLGDEAQQLLPYDLLSQIKHIQEKYEKMQNLSFQHSSSFAQSKTITQALKPWTVSLSQGVANTGQNLEKISVVDMFGDSISVDISIQGTQIIVTPKQNYESGIPYTLVIESGLQSTNGNTLSHGQHLQFTFEK